MKRLVFWAGAGGLLLALAWWWGAGRVLAPAAPTAVVELPVAATPTAPETGATSAKRSADPDGLLFETLLLPDGPIAARTDSVRIGIGIVEPDEARSYQEWLAAGSEGAGPASLAELATVERWIEVPALRLADGRVHLGPLRLPAAERYDLQARGEGPLHFYIRSFTADSMPVSIAPTVAAGLRLRLAPTGAGQPAILLRRGDSALDNASWQSLLAQESPRLLEAFGETALPVEAEQVLAPLQPGPIEVILEVAGVEAQRRKVELIAGQLTELPFDALAIEVASTVSAELELAFVVEGSSEPVADLRVIWQAPRGEQSATTDTRGLVRFAGVDRQATQQFTLQFPPSDAVLPTWPAQKTIELRPEDELAPDPSGSPGRLIRKTIELRPLQWLTVRTGSFAMPGDRQAGNPFPIFVLQAEIDGNWIDSAAENFIPVADGLAVSIEQPGSYRIAALAAPWSVLFSSAADTRLPSSGGQYTVSLQPDPGHRTEVSILHHGSPLSNTPIAVRGLLRGLPPATIKTDARGHLLLDAVTVPELRIEMPGYEVLPVDLGGAKVVVELRAEGDVGGD